MQRTNIMDNENTVELELQRRGWRVSSVGDRGGFYLSGLHIPLEQRSHENVKQFADRIETYFKQTRSAQELSHRTRSATCNG